MLRARRSALLACAMAAALAGCSSHTGTGKPSAAASPSSVADTTRRAPAMVEHIQVQHILVGFSGSIPSKAISRSREEARKLAYELLERARAGDDFDALVRDNTDDRPPGIYGLSNQGVAPAPGEYARGQMVPAFGNVGFALEVGGIGIADYDPTTSPYGWHIIKRVR